MDRFKHRSVVTDIGGWSQANRSGDLSRHVREDVAVEVGENDHVEVFRCVSQTSRPDVDDQMFVLDVLILARDLIEDLVGTGRQ